MFEAACEIWTKERTIESKRKIERWNHGERKSEGDYGIQEV